MDSMMDKTRARRVRMLWAGTALALGAALAGCGGGGEDTGSGGTTPSPSPAPTPTPPVETLALGACEASGKGTDSTRSVRARPTPRSTRCPGKA